MHDKAELPHRYVWSSHNRRPNANAAGSTPGMICYKISINDQDLYRPSAPPLLPRPQVGERLTVETIQLLEQLQARQKEMNNGS